VTLEELNSLDEPAASEALTTCCGSRAWVAGMLHRRPFRSIKDIHATADSIWSTTSEQDWHEAFSHHPQIGARAATTWSSQEQSGMQQASKDTAARMAELNEQYRDKFGFIFIICATGKSVSEMLNAIERRITNSRADELRNAAEEQRKIIGLRLNKLLGA
jgi:2-oxo-4-hydroxy-4-carboxy-5-ureidoimidazoline decarboxylase